jgi:23S rRNA (uracil1939-C5)-methyltransferase
MAKGCAAVAEAVDTEVRALSSDGSGIGSLPDGRVLFIPRSAPGDRLRAEVVQARSRWARGRIVELLESAAERVDPPCPLFDRCGGCQLQHLPYEGQLRWKGRWISDALTRIGGVRIDPPEVVPSPELLSYRSRIELTLRRLRGGRVVAGFHTLGGGRRIVDIRDECLLPVPVIREVWARLRRVWGPGARLLPSGPRLRLTLRATEDGVGLVIQGGRNRGDPEALVREVDGLTAVWLEDAHGGRAHAAGLAVLRESWLGETFELTPDSFVQVNRPAATELMEWVLSKAVETSPSRAVDAYAGVAVYGRVLSRRGVPTVAIELNEAAARVARHGAPDGLEVRVGRVEDLLSDALPADVVIVNPPRAGMHTGVPMALVGHAVPHVVYVSCDPATLARDLERLGDAYEITAVRAQDLFPQTAHVETAVVCKHRKEHT